MGLIKAVVGSVAGTLHDQWKEYIKCDDLGNDILMRKVTTPNGIISKDSAIQVAPGQIAIIFQSGKILRNGEMRETVARSLRCDGFSFCEAGNSDIMKK